MKTLKRFKTLSIILGLVAVIGVPVLLWSQASVPYPHSMFPGSPNCCDLGAIAHPWRALFATDGYFADDLLVNDALTVTGNATLSGTSTFRRKMIVTDAATLLLTSADCGAVVIATLGSGTQTFTLPAATVSGCQFTFIAGDAAGEILIDAAADAQGFVIPTFTAIGADADTAIVTEADGAPGIKNTGGTNAVGDNLTIVADGVLTWYGIGHGTGIWVAQ